MTKGLRKAVKRDVPGRKRNAVAQGAPAADAAPVSAHDRLVAIKLSLEAARTALNGVDANALSDPDHDKWAEEINRVDLAIARVRNSLLSGIAADFEAEMPNIQAAAARLEGDLSNLQKAVDIVNAVSGALGVVEKIISLGL